MPYFGVFLNVFLPMFAQEPFRKMGEVIKKDGPIGIDYCHYTDFHKEMAVMSHTMHKEHLSTNFVDSIGVRAALERGIEVLDIGTGAGYHVLELAKAFPKSRFTGMDVGESRVVGSWGSFKKSI